LTEKGVSFLSKCKRAASERKRGKRKVPVASPKVITGAKGGAKLVKSALRLLSAAYKKKEKGK